MSEGRRSEIEQRLKAHRYDRVTRYRCGCSYEEMEQDDDGDWIRWEHVSPLLDRLSEAEQALFDMQQAPDCWCPGGYDNGEPHTPACMQARRYVLGGQALVALSGAAG